MRYSLFYNINTAIVTLYLSVNVTSGIYLNSTTSPSSNDIVNSVMPPYSALPRVCLDLLKSGCAVTSSDPVSSVSGRLTSYTPAGKSSPTTH